MRPQINPGVTPGERKQGMKHFWRLIMVVAMVWGAGCGKKSAQVVKPNLINPDDVAVWVDQSGITAGQVQREVNRLFAQVPANIPADQIPGIQARLVGEAVEGLIVRQLVRNEMERSKSIITREEIEKGKKDLEAALGPGGSLSVLLAETKLPMEEVEKNLQLDIFKNKMIKEQLDEALAGITEQAVREYYDAHPQEFTQPAGRLASHILLRVPQDATESVKADLRAKAEAIRQELLGGADFAQMAREKSECLSAERGGELGVIPRGREALSFEEAVYGQPFNEIGEVIETPVGFHIVKVTGEQEEKLIPFEEVKGRLTEVLKLQAHQQVTANFIRGLREKATIKLVGPLAEQAPAAPETPAEETAPALPPEAPVSVPAQ
jgi:hypothetical protein